VSKPSELRLVLLVVAFSVLSAILSCGSDQPTPVSVTVEPFLGGIELEGITVEVLLPDTGPTRPYRVVVDEVDLRASLDEAGQVMALNVTMQGRIEAFEDIRLDRFDLRLEPLDPATPFLPLTDHTWFRAIPVRLSAGDVADWWVVFRAVTDEGIRLGVGVDTTGVVYVKDED